MLGSIIDCVFSLQGPHRYWWGFLYCKKCGNVRMWKCENVEVWKCGSVEMLFPED